MRESKVGGGSGNGGKCTVEQTQSATTSAGFDSEGQHNKTVINVHWTFTDLGSNKAWMRGG